MNKLLSTAAILLLTAVILFSASGCTQIEKDGFSPIPQNSPASWEMNPYGSGF